MRPRLPWIALGIGAFLAFLSSGFPAEIAYRWFAPESLILVTPSGTVWSGRAPSAAAPGIAVSDFRWRISPRSFLLGRLGGTMEFRLPDGFASTQFSARMNGNITLEDVQFSSSIGSLADFLPVSDTLGDISATFTTLTFADGWPIAADGEIRLGNLEVAPLFPTAANIRIALGNFRAVVMSSANDEIVANLNDLTGPVEFAGELTLKPDRSFLISGRVRARADAPEELRRGIELMTEEPGPDGMRRWTQSGSL